VHPAPSSHLAPRTLSTQRNHPTAQAKYLPTFTDAERALLKRSYDYMGLTIYTAKYAAETPDNPNGWWIKTTDPSGKVVGAQAESYWLYNVPWSISRMLRYMRDRYDSPYIWVLENGISEKGEAKRAGVAAVTDDLRTDYFKGYITETCKCAACRLLVVCCAWRCTGRASVCLSVCVFARAPSLQHADAHNTAAGVRVHVRERTHMPCAQGRG
jgi:hypothetical protein